MQFQVTLTNNQIESILLQELKSAYDMNRVLCRDEGGHADDDLDSELLYCIERVIEYYSSPEDFDLWQSSLNVKTKSA